MDLITIAIPTYNNEKTLVETLESCLSQDYERIEILVSDNCSTDNTLEIINKYPKITLYKGVTNQGIGPNLENCIDKAKGKYIIFLCADDLFTSNTIVSEIVKIFEDNPKVGYISRWYYQFMNGYKGIIRTHRSNDPLFLADNPSGLAFRKEAMSRKVSNKIFIEGASMVKPVLDAGWEYKIMEYDTIAVRVHPGGNTATKSSYYNNSPILSWYSLIGKNKNLLTHYPVFVQLKNWASYKIMLQEIWLYIKLRPLNLLSPSFYLFALMAILIPKCILRPLTNFYKHRISRYLIKRGNIKW